jgi:orotate phosphoribosyltransferase
LRPWSRARQTGAMQDELIKLLAGRPGHFQMESGYHGETWFDLDRLFDDPARLRPFVSELARRLAAHRIDAVCGPVTGGARLAELIASELGIHGFFAERFEPPGATAVFPVRYSLPMSQRASASGKRFAIVDDAISAGSAVRGTFADLKAHGGVPVVCGALLIFGDAIDGFARQSSLAVESVARTEFRVWLPVECPLCRSGVALERFPTR